jgi:hypothetical protein
MDHGLWRMKNSEQDIDAPRLMGEMGVNEA